MAERKPNVYWKHELNAIAGEPDLEHGREITLAVLGVLGETISEPIDWIPGVSTNKFLDCVVAREIDEWQMDGDIKDNHFHGVNDSGRVSELFGERHLGKLVHSREPMTILVHHEIILETTEIGKAEYDKEGIAIPVDLIPTLPFSDNLGDEVGRTSLGRGNNELKGKRVFLGK